MGLLRQRMCRWCGSLSNDPLERACPSCGGPLPALPAKLLRDNPELVVTDEDFAAIAPGPVPRDLPAGYFQRYLLWTNFGFMWGSVWMGVGAIFVAVSIGLLFAFPPMGGLFCGISVLVVGIGVAATGVGMIQPWRRLMALRNGKHTQGTVVDVREDGAEYRIVYVFEAGDGAHQGEARTDDWMAGQREEGERIWVVYREHDPDQCAVWPPL